MLRRCLTLEFSQDDPFCRMQSESMALFGHVATKTLESHAAPRARRFSTGTRFDQGNSRFVDLAA